MKQPAQHGFTLIELLLYTAISATILISVSAFLNTSLEARVKNQSIIEVDQQGEQALEKITRAVRGASTITSPAAGGSGSSMSVTAPGGTTIFDISNGALRVQEGANPQTPLTNSKVTVTNLTAKNLSRPNTPGVVQVSITISRKNSSGRNEYNYTKTFVTSVAVRR